MINSTFIRFMQFFCYLLLILFTLEGCSVKFPSLKQASEEDKEKIKAALVTKDPLGKVRDEHLIKLESYISANTVSSALALVPNITTTIITHTPTHPLYDAIIQPSRELAKFLEVTNSVMRIVDIDKLGNDKLQFLIFKSTKNMLFSQAKEKVKELLNQQIDVNFIDQEKNSCLHLAIECGAVEIVSLLLEQPKINLKARNIKGNTPTHIAAENGNLDILKLLIDKDVNIEAENNNECTPLHLAAKNGHAEAFQFLIKNRSNYRAIDKYSNNTLHYAVKGGSLDIVELLLERGFNKDTRNNNSKNIHMGVTPLQIAVKKGHLEIVKTLIKSGANFKVLIQYNTQSINKENNPLHTAARKGYTEIANYLVLEKQMDVNARNDWDLTPLHFAAINGNLDIVKLLIDNRANVEAKSSTYYYTSTPLSLAVLNGYLDVADVLIENGAITTEKINYLIELQKQNIGCLTLLHAVIANNDLELASLLIRYGATINRKGIYTNNIADLTIGEEYTEMRELLNSKYISVLDSRLQPLYKHEKASRKAIKEPIRGQPTREELQQLIMPSRYGPMESLPSLLSKLKKQIDK